MDDLIDYSQIKSGYFRKTLESFNIRETIEEVMNIQRKQAEAKKIKLEVEYVGFGNSETSEWDVSEGYDPVMYHDQHRIK